MINKIAQRVLEKISFNIQGMGPVDANVIPESTWTLPNILDMIASSSAISKNTSEDMAKMRYGSDLFQKPVSERLRTTFKPMVSDLAQEYIPTALLTDLAMKPMLAKAIGELPSAVLGSIAKYKMLRGGGPAKMLLGLKHGQSLFS